MAATALGRIGDPRAAGALSMASQDGDADERAAAAAALGQPVPGKPGGPVPKPWKKVQAVALVCDAFITFDSDEAIRGFATKILQSKWVAIELDPKAEVEAAMGFAGSDEKAATELRDLLKRAMATRGVERDPYEVASFTARARCRRPRSGAWLRSSDRTTMSSLTGLAEAGADSALRAAQRRVLGEFRRVLVQEAHHLRLMPDLLWQQTYNRLQWAT